MYALLASVCIVKVGRISVIVTIRDSSPLNSNTMMLCALSGEPAKEPVVSPRSGAIFERKLVESYIATSGKDPINDEPLAVEDLVPIQSQVPVVVPPRPPAFNSIPTMLAAFQNEWDALALETYTLRKQLHIARQELSEALYQYDAAVRVTAKAIKDRDEAQAALQQLSEAFAREAGRAKTEEPMDEGEKLENGDSILTNGENSALDSKEKIPVELLSSARDQLFALHKKQKVTLPVSKTLQLEFVTSKTKHTLKDFSGFSANSDGSKILLSSSTKIQLLPETTVFDIQGVSATAVLNDQDSQKIVAFSNGEIIDLLSDERTSLPLDTITKVIPHPSQPLFVALTDKNEWALCNESSIIYKAALEEAVVTADLHVDGVLLGIGTTTGNVLIYDLTSTEKVSSIITHFPNVNKLQFALNGYWLAVASSEQEKTALEIFDLRKNSLVHKIAFESPIDFVLDPSCLALVVYETHSSKLLVNLYIKKGKLWVDHAAELSTEELTHLVSESTAQTVQDTKKVKLAGIGKSQTVHYEISIS